MDLYTPRFGSAGAVFECQERRGTQLRRVTEVPASPVLEAYLRERMPLNASPMKSIEHIYSRGVRIFLVDDVGMMMKGIIELQGMCDVHICFWDKILYGREQMASYMAKMVAADANFAGAWTAIPTDSRTTLAFARRCGFEEFHRTDSIVALSLLVT